MTNFKVRPSELLPEGTEISDLNDRVPFSDATSAHSVRESERLSQSEL